VVFAGRERDVREVDNYWPSPAEIRFRKRYDAAGYDFTFVQWLTTGRAR